ncbi:hypothetical protein FV226_24160 [Methylobacterium sp. WL12]|uniref:hypothetical protein n=1 Tax=unclassified Methylobacterium TaxID=2615210 RepID=UPI0011CA04D8|nr:MULTISPECIES: hypothetical protein [unclassified Methylobacterium]TXM65998.1 hypothetical protein FV226_24160 [Methylobacterium sp. WL12]TXM70420.1 hypothetical protein FV229_02410 [Methylobacterium sp. WL120]
MPVRFLLILILASIATPALALQQQDTLRDWSAATGADRDRLLQQLEKSSEGSAPRKNVLSCINDAAGMSAHADLAISDVFMACTKQKPEDSI